LIYINEYTQPLIILMVATLSTPFDIVLVATAVALNTVFKLANSFFKVLAPDIGWRVLMASVTGVTLVVIEHMAGNTTRCVIAV
jgi:hypothetical protein